MALASKVNLPPLGGLILIAAFIGAADMRLRSQRDLLRIVAGVAAFVLLAVVATLVTFRVTQPMSLPGHHRRHHHAYPAPQPGLGRQHEGGPERIERHRRRAARRAVGAPPGDHFPAENMVIWGMGLPLGMAVWAGFLWAAWRVFGMVAAGAPT